MPDSLFRGLFDTDMTRVILISDFLLCIGCSLLIGLILAFGYMYRSRFTKSFIATLALLPAVVCVVTFFRFPLLGSKVHFANTMCLLSGLLMGPVGGGLAAGFGSALYDALWGGYDIIQCLITFVSKFIMAWLCAKIAFSGGREAKNHGWNVAACIIGALSYVALYMLKTWLFKMYVEPVPAETIPGIMVAKLIPSLINAAFAVVTAPIFYHAVRPALKASGILKQLEG